MTNIEHKNILDKVNNALATAENVWGEVGHHFSQESYLIKEAVLAQATQIPGFPFVNDGEPKVSDFIAIFVDIRNSTKHLTQNISAKASMLKRVHFETTALFAAGGEIIEQYDGKITEYLGDGFLALFNVNEDRKVVYQAHSFAKKILNANNEIISPILYERYDLPPLDIGIGMAYSKAIVTLVGHNHKQPKALGECVYRASKLSDGKNEIHIDERLKQLWPKSKGGKLQFQQKKMDLKFKSYLINKN